MFTKKDDSICVTQWNGSQFKKKSLANFDVKWCIRILLDLSNFISRSAETFTCVCVLFSCSNVDLTLNALATEPPQQSSRKSSRAYHDWIKNSKKLSRCLTRKLYQLQNYTASEAYACCCRCIIFSFGAAVSSSLSLSVLLTTWLNLQLSLWKFFEQINWLIDWYGNFLVLIGCLVSFSFPLFFSVYFCTGN